MTYHPLLQKQLQDACGIASIDALQRALDGCRDDEAGRRTLLDGLPALLRRIDRVYREHDAARQDQASVPAALVRELVDEHETQRHELANQRFALDPHGRPFQYVAIRTDLTAQYRAADKLRESLAFIDALFEAIPLPVYLKDARGRYLRLNRAFCDFFGVAAADCLGKTSHELLPAGEAEFNSADDRRLMRAGGSHSYSTVLTAGARGPLDVIYTKATLAGPDGKVRGLVGTISDISAQKQGERTLRQAKEAAEAVSRAKSEFLAAMSHEARTPLTGIIGMTDLVLESELGAQQREYLGIAKASAHILLGIVDDILELSEIEAGTAAFESVSFDPAGLLADCARPFAAAARDKGLAFALESDPALPARVTGDARRLRRVLGKVLGNAVKFTREGSVTLRAAVLAADAAQARLAFEITDTGIGIEADKQQAVFEAFTQADGSATRRFGGTGLGLTLVRRLLALMGGTIALDSAPGRGSRFTIELPLEIETAAGAPIPARRPEPGQDAKPLHILLAEDNPLNRKLACTLLQKWGHRVELACDGEQALRLHAGRRFDLILMDLQMPGLDGWAATAEIRRREAGAAARTPVVALTAEAQAADRDKCLAAGMDDYLSKPFKTAQFAALLAKFGGASQPPVEPARPAVQDAAPAGGGAGFDYARALRAADPEVVGLIAAHFCRQGPRMLAEMRAAASRGELAELRRHAHTLAGLLGNFGAEPARQAAEALNAAARAGRLDRVQAEFERLACEIGLLVPHLQRFGPEQQAGP